jgi:hypothetical protein
MFLDEKLYNHVKNSSHVDGEEFRVMLNQLYDMCQEHYKANIKEGMDKKTAKAAIDRTFNAWNLMLTSLKKDNYPFLQLLEEYSFKTTFMQNEDVKAFYKTL